MLKRLGYKIAVISGGFSRAAEALKRRLGVDYAYSNNLEVAGRQAHRPRRRADRQRAAQGGAAGDHRAGRGRAAGPGDRRGRRRQRRADAGTRRPGHRVPRQAEAARGGRHQHLRRRAGRDPLPARASPRGSCRRWSEGGRRDTGAGARRWCWRRRLAADGERGRRGRSGATATSCGRPARRPRVSTCPGCAATAPASAPTPRRSKPRWPSAWAAIRSRARRRSSSRRSSRRRPEGFQVTIAMRGGDGKLLGNRALTSSPGDCRSIATAAALTIAILIDPDALARAPAPKPPPAPPPSPAPQPPAARAFRPGGSRRSPARAGAWCPGSPRAAGLAATVDVSRRRSPSASPRCSSPSAARRRPTTASPSAWRTASWSAASSRSRRRRGLRWELCAGATAGVLHAVVFSADTHRTRAALDVRGRRADARHHPDLSGRWWPEIGLEATQPLPRRAFFVEGRPAGMDTVFTQPVCDSGRLGGRRATLEITSLDDAHEDRLIRPTSTELRSGSCRRRGDGAPQPLEVRDDLPRARALRLAQPAAPRHPSVRSRRRRAGRVHDRAPAAATRSIAARAFRPGCSASACASPRTTAGGGAGRTRC